MKRRKIELQSRMKRNSRFNLRPFTYIPKGSSSFISFSSLATPLNSTVVVISTHFKCTPRSLSLPFLLGIPDSPSSMTATSLCKHTDAYIGKTCSPLRPDWRGETQEQQTASLRGRSQRSRKQQEDSRRQERQTGGESKRVKKRARNKNEIRRTSTRKKKKINEVSGKQKSHVKTNTQQITEKINRKRIK